MATALKHALIEPYRASSRALSSDLGWLTSHRSFNSPTYYSPSHAHFGPIRILNEDTVAPSSGFAAHAHRDAEIFSYILRGELTHRDSTVPASIASSGGGSTGPPADNPLFSRLRRGDVQLSSAGTGVRHSETNESAVEPVSFLQIWVLPWRMGLAPVYHTQAFAEVEKRSGFVTIISPLRGGVEATALQEKAAEGVVPGTIPIHADFLFGAGIIPVGGVFVWRVAGGAGLVASREDRQVYVYLPMMKDGKTKVRLNGSDDAILAEGDGAFVRGLGEGDELGFESIGEEEAEVVVLDANHN